MPCRSHLAILMAGLLQAASLPAQTRLAMSLTLMSPAFAAGAALPERFSCEGAGVSPPLAWSGVPAGTRSLALVIEDPDAPDPAAPRVTWVHWILYDLPAEATELPEAVPAAGLPPGTRQGRNGWQRTGYGAACPPVGRHRYFHRLYALDVVLPDLHAPDRSALERAMQGHVLAQAELVGTYQARQH